MLRVDSKNINYSAVSVVNNEVIASFYGDCNANHVGVSINFEDISKFTTNLATIETDLSSFLDQIAEEL